MGKIEKNNVLAELKERLAENKREYMVKAYKARAEIAEKKYETQFTRDWD